MIVRKKPGQRNSKERLRLIPTTLCEVGGGGGGGGGVGTLRVFSQENLNLFNIRFRHIEKKISDFFLTI
jgi:hypothetical protein